MAKAADIVVDPWEPYRVAAARIVRTRARELFENAENVLDTDDIERVHDMRVASRRLRAVLEIFAPCFPRGPYRSVLNDVKAIADALGERRDPDVHIVAMQKMSEQLADHQRAGLQILIDRFRAQQARGNEVLAAALQELEDSELALRLEELADAAHPEPDPPAPPETL